MTAAYGACCATDLIVPTARESPSIISTLLPGSSATVEVETYAFRAAAGCGEWAMGGAFRFRLGRT